MNPDIMNPDDLTLDVFNKTLLPRAAFTLLPENARNVYAGASARCLYAIVDGLEILCEDGAFYVYGIYGRWRDFEAWCVLFSDDIAREQVL
jgi:hypothetical protein